MNIYIYYIYIYIYIYTNIYKVLHGVIFSSCSTCRECVCECVECFDAHLAPTPLCVCVCVCVFCV